MDDYRCPDCGVTMESTPLQTSGGHTLRIETGTRDGVLGTIGLSETTGVDSVCCPECGLVRLYADLE
ncbi:hypothetical protein [Natrinema sp. HArc-T2]|uniref:hypothetical protein n=1 Tax=Natrinema sp. HArc-T2 TaxID=3242701 RepID=UPI00359E45F0